MFSLLIIILFFTLPFRSSTHFHYLSINENDIAPRHLLTFNSPQANTSYTLISPKLHKYFSIKNQTQLYTLRSFDREYICKKKFCSCFIPCSIELKILSQPDHQILYINLTINDLNDNLHYFHLNQLEINIPENTKRQCYRIPSVYDEDLPETNRFNYRLIGDGNNRFEIDKNLCLKLKNISLDREECDRYDNLWIIAEDQQKQQAKLKILIHVLDINDNSPKFLTNSTTLHINETFTGQLTCLTAYDPDEGNNGRVIYSFNHLDKKLLNYFFLNNETGCINILEPLLLINHLLITIRAQDSGSSMSLTLPVYHLLELFIHHKPIIEVRQMIYGIEILKNNSQINITENTIGNLALIKIDDRNQGIYGNIQFNCIIQSKFKTHQQAFILKSTSIKHYKLELINPLDYELESNFDLYLDAIDNQGESTRFVINIIIEDINDIPPKFQQDYYYFNANSQSIGQVHADDDNPLIYSLNSDLFNINSQTGEINLIKPLSTDQIFTFNVNVTDGKYISQTNVTISIQGYNPPPEFDKDEYYFQINENIPIRTIIGKINVSSKRGELTYSLESITLYSEFFLHISYSGEIILMRIPDAEQQQIHEFIVTVKDHANPSLSDQAKLIIKINDINEYCPKLINKSSEPYLFISRENFSIFSYHLSAFDKDISDQSNIKFSLLSSSYSHLFQLNSNGLLILKELPLNIPSFIELRYTLSDQFYRHPCVVQDKLILLIGETLNDSYYQYEKEFNHLRKPRFVLQQFQNPKIIFSFLIISLSLSAIFVGILRLLFILCSRKRKRRRSTYIINPTLLMDNYKRPSSRWVIINSK